MKLFIFLLISRIAYSNDVVLITADRIKSDISKSSSSVELIDEKTLSLIHTDTLPELLKENSDIHIANGSIFLRGTDSAHTLIIMDGVVLSDPSNPNRSFDISKLSLNNVKNIEILRGPQGLLYGANAVGGVIIITSKTKASDAISGSSLISYGTYQTYTVGLDTQKKIGINHVSFGAEHFKTNGFSAANVANGEPDGEKRSTLNMHTQTEINAHTSIDTSIRYNYDFQDLDNCGGAGCDDSKNNLTNEEILTHLQFNKTWESELLDTHIFYNRGKYSRLNNTSTTSDLYKGESNSIGINHTNYINEKLTQNINLDFTQESNQLHQSSDNSSIFLYHKYELENSLYNFGLRLDHHSIFNNHFTYKIATATKINTEQLIRLSYSTGFKAPGLYELLNPTTGNINLKPENTRSLELGHEWTKNSNQLHTTFFTTIIKDQFTYISSLKKTINSGTTYINGIESSLLTSLSNTSATLLNKKREHRPQVVLKNIFFIGQLNFESQYVGQSLDAYWSPTYVKTPVIVPSYIVHNLSYTYKNIFLKIKNIFNTEYEESYGYGTGGRIITLGFKNNF